jgi:uncharacterized protein (DUF169 family)
MAATEVRYIQTGESSIEVGEAGRRLKMHFTDEELQRADLADKKIDRIIERMEYARKRLDAITAAKPERRIKAE